MTMPKATIEEREANEKAWEEFHPLGDAAVVAAIEVREIPMYMAANVPAVRDDIPPCDQITKH